MNAVSQGSLKNHHKGYYFFICTVLLFQEAGWFEIWIDAKLQLKKSQGGPSFKSAGTLVSFTKVCSKTTFLVNIFITQLK